MSDQNPAPCRYCGSTEIGWLYGQSDCARKWGYKYRCRECGHTGPTDTDRECARIAWDEVNR